MGFPVYGTVGYGISGLPDTQSPPRLLRIQDDEITVLPFPDVFAEKGATVLLGEDGEPAGFADATRARLRQNGTWREYIFPGQWQHLRDFTVTENGMLAALVTDGEATALLEIQTSQ